MLKNRKKGISLALGGGGVRSCIYIGFYEVLKDEGIPVRCVTGTSMGAFFAAAIALDFSIDEMKELAVQYGGIDFFTFENFNYFNESLVKRDWITKSLKKIFGKATFEDAKIPCGCPAVDIEERKTVNFTSGSIVTAVEASSAYPLIFPPVFYEGGYLVDGGILDAVPVELARELGAENLVAINIKNDIVRQHLAGQIFLKHYQSPLKENFYKRLFGFFKRKKEDLRFLLDIMLETVSIATENNKQASLKRAKPELLIEPTVNIPLLDFSKVDAAIDIGRELARKNLEEIKKLAGV